MIARKLGSVPLQSEASLTFLDGVLSVLTLTGLALNASLGWSWATRRRAPRGRRRAPRGTREPRGVAARRLRPCAAGRDIRPAGRGTGGGTRGPSRAPPFAVGGGCDDDPRDRRPFADLDPARYRARRRAEGFPRPHPVLTVAPRRFVMIGGEGPPVAEAFEARIPGLYGVAYPIRFALKRRGVLGRVGPLEGIWWTTDGETDLDSVFAGDRDTWRWTLMIGVPDEATDAEIAEHLEAGRAKLAPGLAASLYVDLFDEGPAAQLLHVGPYAEERPTIERLHEQIAAAGLRPRGHHHELYLGDPRRSAPERLRT